MCPTIVVPQSANAPVIVKVDNNPLLFTGQCLHLAAIMQTQKQYLLLVSPFEKNTGPCSAVGNVSGNICVSDCRSRARDPIPALFHIFVEINHKIISTAILLPSAESFKKGCCQLQAKVYARSTGKLLVQAFPGNKCGYVN